MTTNTCTFLFVVLLGLQLTGQPALAATHREKILYRIDFTKISVNTRQWLQTYGFRLHKEMTSGGDIQLSGDKEKGLVITIKKAAFGFAVLRGLNIENVGKLEIEWGVDFFPKGASWKKNIHREPVMVTFFFGPPVKADHFFLPDSPCFIGVFLNKDDETGIPLVGKSYTKTGRYCCLCTPVAGRTVTSIFAPALQYRKWFGAQSPVPPLTGIGIEADTSGLDNGKSRAFIRKIIVYQKQEEG